MRARQRIDDVVCDTQYSAVEPSSDGEVIFKAIPPQIVQLNPFSEEALDILSITNLRINFTKLHTFGDNLLDSREEIKEKYYYAIKEMYVRGSCFCNGHASHCVADPDINQVTKPEMVSEAGFPRALRDCVTFVQRHNVMLTQILSKDAEILVTTRCKI